MNKPKPKQKTSTLGQNQENSSSVDENDPKNRLDGLAIDALNVSESKGTSKRAQEDKEQLSSDDELQMKAGESSPMNEAESKMAGRWGKSEHYRFIEALKKYGKNWKKVEEHVGSRTGAQIRSHAQKFFNRLQRELQEGEIVPPSHNNVSENTELGHRVSDTNRKKHPQDRISLSKYQLGLN